MLKCARPSVYNPIVRDRVSVLTFGSTRRRNRALLTRLDGGTINNHTGKFLARRAQTSQSMLLLRSPSRDTRAFLPLSQQVHFFSTETDDRLNSNHPLPFVSTAVSTDTNTTGQVDENQQTNQDESGVSLYRDKLAKIDRETIEAVEEILDMLQENGDTKIIQKFKFHMSHRPIFIPDPNKDEQEGVAETIQNLSDGHDQLIPFQDASTELHFDDDLSPWDGYLMEADKANRSTKRRRRQRRWKVRRGIQNALSLLRVMPSKKWNDIDRILDGNEGIESIVAFQDDSFSTLQEEALVDDTESENNSQEQADIHDIEKESVCQYSDLNEDDITNEIEEALALASSEDENLDAAFMNVILARISVALELSSSECYEHVLRILNAMEENEKVMADPISYEILIRLVAQRAGSPHTALRFVKDLVKNPSLRSPDSLRAAFQLCSLVKETNLALDLWNRYINDDQTKYHLPFDVLNTLVMICKAAFLEEIAMEVIRLALKQNQSRSNKSLDNVFESICSWPTKSSEGNRKILEAVLDALSKNDLYEPSPFVWKQLAIAANKNSEYDDRRIRIVHDAFRQLIERYNNFCPDGRLAIIGFDVCRKTKDPQLALEILARRLTEVIHAKEHNELVPHELPDQDFDDTSDNTPRQTFRVSTEEVNLVVSICVDTNASDVILSVLSLIDEFNVAFHPNLYPQVASVAIRIISGQGRLEAGESLLQRMIQLGYQPREEDYGALMLGYVHSGERETAKKLFETLEKEEGNLVSPGQMCFNALILGCIQDRDWEDAMSLHDKMISLGIKPCSATYSGLLIASHQTGGKEQTLFFLSEMIDSEAHVTAETAELAIKLLLPGFESEQTFHGIRSRMRDMVDNTSIDSKDKLIDLMKVIRDAEQEDCKLKNKHFLSTEHADGWRTVLSYVLEFAKVELSSHA